LSVFIKYSITYNLKAQYFQSDRQVIEDMCGRVAVQIASAAEFC